LISDTVVSHTNIFHPPPTICEKCKSDIQIINTYYYSTSLNELCYHLHILSRYFDVVRQGREPNIENASPLCTSDELGGLILGRTAVEKLVSTEEWFIPGKSNNEKSDSLSCTGVISVVAAAEGE
jgi:hypothetical protein